MRYRERKNEQIARSRNVKNKSKKTKRNKETITPANQQCKKD